MCKLDYYAIPNGTNIQNIATRKATNAMGRKKGVPDLHIPVPVFSLTGIEYLSTYIEVKLPGTYQTKDQKDWQQRLEKNGHYVIVIRSVTELIEMLKSKYPNYLSRIKF